MAVLTAVCFLPTERIMVKNILITCLEAKCINAIFIITRSITQTKLNVVQLTYNQHAHVPPEAQAP